MGNDQLPIFTPNRPPPIETVEPGKPLGFLDAAIRCGDALLGVFDLSALEHGVPDAAYKPLAGDDRAAAKALEKRNAADKKGQGSLGFFTETAGRMPPAATLARAEAAWRVLPEDSPTEIAAKGLTPYEFICKCWTSEPKRFRLDPLHQMPGLNT